MTWVLRCYDKADGTLIHEERGPRWLMATAARLFPVVERVQARVAPRKYGHLPRSVYIAEPCDRAGAA